jgi:octaprenyl-diphosphate synthase
VRRRVACFNQRWHNNTAVLLGDFLYARAFARSTDLSSRLCSRLLAATTRDICVAEIEQSARRWDFDQTQEAYEAIAGGKTASLYAAACELGARYPGGNEELGARMRTFGWELGLAFQIMDDCLDLLGDELIVGKSVGTDVEDGKVTLPVLYTYRLASAEQRAAMRDAYTLPGLQDRARALRGACNLGPGIEFAAARARHLVQAALERLEVLPRGPARSALEEAAEFVLHRNW